MTDSKAVSLILQAEREWLLAHLNCDVAALGHLMADEYVQTNSIGGIVRKAEVIALFESGARQWDEARSDELQVRVYGEAAVVIGHWQARGVNAGQAFDYAARYVSVWVLRDGRWQAVHGNQVAQKYGVSRRWHREQLHQQMAWPSRGLRWGCSSAHLRHYRQRSAPSLTSG